MAFRSFCIWTLHL